MTRRGCLGSLFGRWWPFPDRDDAEHAAIRRARRDAEAQLRRARARGPEVARIARQAAEYRTSNHFAEMIEEALRRGEP